MALKHGKHGRLLITPEGGSEVEIAVTNVQLNVRNELYDATTSKSGGVRRRDAGLDDSEGSFELILDDAELPASAAFGIRKGAGATLKQFVDATRFQQVDVVIESVATPVDVEREIRVTVRFRGNGPVIEMTA